MTPVRVLPLTLLDYPGRVACTFFITGCNLRCPFCHNAPLVRAAGEGGAADFAPLFSFLEKRRGLLEGVCITGGEPTLRGDLPGLIRKIKALGYLVKLDTNGTNPDMLEALINAGEVDYVAMDIKNSPAKYSVTAGIPLFDIKSVERSAALLLEAGRRDFECEFRTTVVGNFHEGSDFEAIGRWLAGARRYFLQPFIDTGDLIRSGLSGVDMPTMKEYLEIIRKFIPAAELRGV